MSKRQLVGVVDSASAPAHVLFPRVGSALTTATSFLLTAEGTANLSATRANVAVDDTAVRAKRSSPLVHVLEGLGEHGRRKTLWHSIVHCDSLINCLEFHHINDRGKDLLLNNWSFRVDSDDSRLNVVAWHVGAHFTTAKNLASLGLNLFKTVNIILDALF